MEEELEGADFTSTVEHIHQIYSFLYINCSQSCLKELFQHNPAVFVEKHRQVFGRITLLRLFSDWQQVTLCTVWLQAGWKVVFRPVLPPEGGVLG